jgi:hypothetical protein
LLPQAKRKTIIKEHSDIVNEWWVLVFMYEPPSDAFPKRKSPSHGPESWRFYPSVGSGFVQAGYALYKINNSMKCFLTVINQEPVKNSRAPFLRMNRTLVLQGGFLLLTASHFYQNVWTRQRRNRHCS